MRQRSRAVLQSATGLVADGGTRDDRGQKRHRILRELRHELERHPAVTQVRGHPDGTYRELRATLDPTVLGRSVEHATLRVSWWPAPENPEFVVHYRDDTGFDCGWHREPNPHVDGPLHYQERHSPTDAYEYESLTLSANSPTRILWTILDRLPDRLP